VPILSAGSCRREWNRAEAGALGCPAQPRLASRPPPLRLCWRICPALTGGVSLQRAPPEDPPTGSAASGSRQEAIRAGATRPGRTARHILLVPIREVSTCDHQFALRRLSMRRIIARRTNAAALRA
jgi:hypothetical protein